MIDPVLEALLGPLRSAMVAGRDPLKDLRGAGRRARSDASGGEVLVPFWLLDGSDDEPKAWAGLGVWKQSIRTPSSAWTEVFGADPRQILTRVRFGTEGVREDVWCPSEPIPIAATGRQGYRQPPEIRIGRLKQGARGGISSWLGRGILDVTRIPWPR